MRSVVQRVTVASVLVEGQEIARIGTGLLALVGVGVGDDEGAAVTLADKIVDLRVFEDAQGKMNHSVLDIRGEVLLVSQFTLLGDARRGRRPSFTDAMEPVRAEVLFQRVCERVREREIRVSTGKFRADMKVMLVNDGPVTLLLDTNRAF
jgi:D-tyrosyl-tRNA(Tyr) deacylase